jgi:hypothetical protein
MLQADEGVMMGGEGHEYHPTLHHYHPHPHSLSRRRTQQFSTPRSQCAVWMPFAASFWRRALTSTRPYVHAARWSVSTRPEETLKV